MDASVEVSFYDLLYEEMDRSKVKTRLPLFFVESLFALERKASLGGFDNSYALISLRGLSYNVNFLLPFEPTSHWRLNIILP